MNSINITLRSFVFSSALSAGFLLLPITASQAQPSLTSIIVSPADTAINIGQTQHYTAMGTFDDGSSRALDHGNTWSPLAATVSNHLAGDVVAINGIVYAVGGDDPTSPAGNQTTLEAYDRATDTWTSLSPMPTGRYCHGAGAVNGILYVIGGVQEFGNIRVSLSTVEAYDPATDSWTTKSPMPNLRGCVEVGTVDGILYAVESGSYDTQRLLAYDPVTDTWSNKPSIPSPTNNLSNFAVAGLDGVLYVVGGYSSDALAYSTTVFAYYPAVNKWKIKSPLPTPRQGLAAAAVDGMLYAVGGWYLEEKVVEAYQPETDSWMSMAPLPQWELGSYVYATGDETSGTLYALAESEDYNVASVRSLFTFTPAEVFWSSSKPLVATIDGATDGSALATAPLSLHDGITKITATVGTISGSTSLTTLPLPLRQLLVKTTGDGSGYVTGTDISCADECAVAYLQGTTVTLYADPSRDNRFLSWGGDCKGQGNPCTLQMDVSHKVTAAFKDVPY